MGKSVLKLIFRTMKIRAISQIAELAPYQEWWNERAGDCPFRTWEWLTTWWKHYGEGRQLRVLVVLDDSSAQIIGILPAYLETSRTRGKVLRLLGDGEVCSEHLDLLSDSQSRGEVCRQIAEYLTVQALDWDLFQITALAERERNLGRLIEELSTQGCAAHRATGVNLWSIPLPDTWDEFLAMQSKSHRKQLRQLKSRVLESPRIEWKSIEIKQQFDATWEILIDLHQRRRQSLGEPGCFASSAWANFHREVAEKLLSAGRLRLSVLNFDGKPIAAEYHLADYDATYAYQGGIDPGRPDEEPGQLSMILCVERAIAEGHKRFELLRGDEPYKPHWRASPAATVDVDVISPRAVARWRHHSWRTVRRAGRFVRQFTNLLG